MTQELCTWLYTPASSAEKLQKSLLRGADAVIFDLEDAVHPDQKPAARQALREFLSDGVPVESSRVYVRVNALDSAWGRADLEALTGLDAVEGIRVPKVESAAQLSEVRRILGAGPQIQALVESPAGTHALSEICFSDHAAAVSLGESDLRAELNLDGDVVLDQLRGQLVLLLAAAGKAAPTASVYPRIKDLEGLRDDCARLRRMGFYGRTVLHPLQLEVVAEAFTPTAQEQEWAHRVVEADQASAEKGEGAVMLDDGQFVDRPFVVKARTILRRAGVQSAQP